MDLPRPPFVGEVGYAEVIELLRRQSRWLSRAERVVAANLSDYLEYKLVTAPGRMTYRKSIDAPPADSLAGGYRSNILPGT